MSTEKPEKQRRSTSYGHKLRELRQLRLDEIYDIFESLRALDPLIEKDLKYILNRLFIQEYNEPLTLDDKALVAEKVEEIVEKLSNQIYNILKKHVSEQKQTVTEGSLKHMSMTRATELLSRALRIVIVNYGAW